MPVRNHHPPNFQLLYPTTNRIWVRLGQPIKRMRALPPHNLWIKCIPALRVHYVPRQRNNALNTDFLRLVRFPERHDVSSAHALAFFLLGVLHERSAVLVLYLGRPFAHGGYDDPVLGAGFMDGG